MVYLELPLPPTLNHYQPHTARGGRCVRYLSMEAKQFKAEVNYIVQYEKAAKKLSGRLSVEIILHFKDKRRTDLDNRIKACLDALQSAGVFEDDSQIDRLMVARGDNIKGGKCSVEIKEG